MAPKEIYFLDPGSQEDAAWQRGIKLAGEFMLLLSYLQVARFSWIILGGAV